MKRRRALLTMSVCVLVLGMASGCVSVMQRTTFTSSPAAGKALISFYYRFNPLAGTPIEIFVDDRSLGTITMRTGLQAQVTPGKHTIYARMDRSWAVMDAEVESGKHYFVYLQVTPGWGSGTVTLDPVTQAENPASVSGAFASALMMQVNPMKKEAWEQKRANAIRRIEARHKAGKTRPTKLSPEDGI